MIEIKNALISVSNKEGILELAKFLDEKGINILSTSGTFKFLSENGIKNIISISDYTETDELIGGRVKTLHPNIFAGIMANRENETHMIELREKNIIPIDLVVVNLYPFQEGILNNLEHEKMIELIDIGGVSLLRAAAKNYLSCLVLTDEDDYKDFINEYQMNDGKIPLQFRIEKALKVFYLTSEYDSNIASYISRISGISEKIYEMPKIFSLNLKKIKDLRYGENPHQHASLYEWEDNRFSLTNAIQLNGKEMSYNNYIDADTALNIVLEFETPCCAIIKHSTPCGVGCGINVNEAFNKAYITDPVSAFGGIVAFNKTLDIITANDMSSMFFDVVIAPDYEEEALDVLKAKKNLRVLKVDLSKFSNKPFIVIQKIGGGLLVQEGNNEIEDPTKWEFVSDREPTELEMESAIFAWKIVKWVKSNGIVIASKDMTFGIGSGQPSRIGSAEIAINKAHNQGKYTGGCVLASDGFLPFRDTVDIAAEAGITAIIEPGGSVRDKEVIEACNEKDIALIFTHRRSFRH